MEELWKHIIGGNYYKEVNGVAMGTKMGPSYANLFVGFIEHSFSVNATVLNVNYTVATRTILSALPFLPGRSSLNL